MTKANKVLYITQEITPYVSESEMSLIGRNLPQAIQEKGREIRTFMPKWGNINERRNQLHEVIRLSGMNLIIDDTDHPLIIKVASIQSARMPVLKIIIVIDEIYLHACGLDRSNFYNQGVVSIIDNQVHTREADHFVQLISALIDVSPFGHKGSDFTAFFLDRLWKVSTYIGHFGF